MSTEATTTPATQTTAKTTTQTPAGSAALTGTDVFVGVLKLAGLAFTAYKAASHRKQNQQAAALSASVARGNEGASMASVDKNALLNMALQHMRNMNRPMMK